MKKRAKAASASSSTHALSERDSDQTTRLDYTDTKLQVSKYKVVSSGESVDIYEYEVPIARGIKKQRAQNRAAIYNRNSEYQTKSITRAKNKIRRLILSNFKTNDKFITLTFNDENVFDINKLEVCLKYYKKFVRKLKNIYPAIKYIAVPEFQKRGAVHYHIICNLPHLDKDKIQSLWGHGFIKIKAIFDSQSAAIYLTKYLSKRFDYKRSCIIGSITHPKI